MFSFLRKPHKGGEAPAGWWGAIPVRNVLTFLVSDRAEETDTELDCDKHTRDTKTDGERYAHDVEQDRKSVV